MLKDNQKFNENIKPNSEFLRELKNKLPEFFTAKKYDEDGNIIEEECFDNEKFQRAIKERNIKELSSGYQIDFIGRNYARKQSGERPSTVIVPDSVHNQKEENMNSKNLFFTGDNLETLRHLQQNYSNSIDLIYIDPPYNTGSDGFVYPDNFEYTDEQLKEMFALDEDGLKRLKSIQGKSTHSAWLAFMYPRLYLAKKLLTDSGVIFVSIDNNEQSNLKLLMDDIFGEGSFISNMIRLTSPQRFAQEKGIDNSNDFVLAYSKNKFDAFSKVTLKNKKNKILKQDHIGSYYQGDTKAILAPISQGYSRGGDYDFEYNGKLYKPVDNKGNRNRWFWTKDRMEAAANLGILVETSNTLRMQIYQDKKFEENTNMMVDKESGVVPTTLDLIENKFSNPNGVSDIEALGFGKIFSYPKPVELIKFLVNLLKKKDLLILDFFAGSSTTADAIMQLNAEDGGNRQFIMCTLPEPTYKLDNNGNEIPTKGGAAAYKAGFKSIDEFSRERIIRAANNIKKESPLLNESQYFGFKHFRVISPSQEKIDKIEYDKELQLDLFDDMIDMFSSEKLGVDGGTDGFDTILQTYLVKDNYKFDVSIKMIECAGIFVPYVDNQRIYIITKEWNSKNTKSLVDAIGKNEISVQTIVVYGYTIDMESLRELEIGLNQLENKVNLQVRY